MLTLPTAFGLAPITRRVMNASPADVRRGRYADSVAVGDKCFCLSTFDHGIGSVRVDGRTVRDICDEIGPPPGRRDQWTFYNTVQCGHDPANSSIDERECPGLVGAGRAGCRRKGPKWELTDVCTCP